MIQHMAAGIIIALASAYIIYTIVEKARKGVCSCGKSGGKCPKGDGRCHCNKCELNK